MAISDTRPRPQNITVFLRIATASHRRRILGISRSLTPQDIWNIQIIPEESRLAELLESTTPDIRPDGIITGELYNSRTRQLIQKSNIPLVGIGIDSELRQKRRQNAAFILNDNEGIGKAAADYFKSLGNFRSYAYIPAIGGSQQWSIQRGNGFTHRLRDNGIDCKVYRQCDNIDDDWQELGRFLTSLEKPAAVLAAWDGRAVEVMNSAKLAGIEVPEQMAVLGVDDDDIICENAVPQLSSVRTDVEGMGEKATKLLKKLLSQNKNRLPNGSQSVTCPALGITERNSTRPPTPAAHLINRALSFIAAEASNGIDVQDVAKHLKISRRLLDMRFKKYSQTTVAETIALRRLETAKHLLEKTTMPVKAAFKAAGFSDTTYPYRLFKKKTGVSPSKWRRTAIG